MKSKILTACLLVAASLSTASFVAQAGDTPQETVQPSNINARDLKEGDRAPDMLMRKESAVTDWKKRGLKQPEEESQWTRVGDKFVLLKTTNGTILEITPSRSNPLVTSSASDKGNRPQGPCYLPQESGFYYVVDKGRSSSVSLPTLLLCNS